MTSILPSQRSMMLTNDFSMEMQTTFQMSDQLLDHRSIMPSDQRDRMGYKTQSFSEDPEANDEVADGSGNEIGDGNSSGTEGPLRKRRRSRKGLDKKFLCPQDGCGKSYSRAEHLYRHQLNHTPKQIFNCDFPACTRTFVRQDLCNRHKERHTAKGSQLHRKDSMLSRPAPVTDINHASATYHVTGEELGSHVSGIAARTVPIQFSSSADIDTNGYGLVTDAVSGSFPSRAPSHDIEKYMGTEAFKRSNSESFARGNVPLVARSGPRNARHSSFGISEAKPTDLVQTSFNTARLASPPTANMFATSLMTSQGFVTSQNFATYPMQPPTFMTNSTALANTENDMYPASAPIDYMKDPGKQISSGPDMMLLEQMSEPSILPVFGGVEYNRSPFAIPEDLVAYLFNGQQLDLSSQGAYGGHTNYADVPYSTPYIGSEISADDFFPTNPQQLHRNMAVTTLLLDTSSPDSMISDEKSQAIVDLIGDRFTDAQHAPTARKESILEGDRSVDGHMLSRNMMQMYIGSYWYHFSEQLPILHKPTFVPDETPELLLIAIMAIGAAGIQNSHGLNVAQAGVELSNFLAWHLRWEIFSHDHFRPPAKLWVFQALLLMELYEKMFSTRALHERAHIHHATTITLMRRGSSLIGKPALDSPPSVKDERHGLNSSRNSSTSGSLSPSEWWHHWITNEATRRAAFAAFVLDSTHATMFGHSTVMVAHEMRLALPCDDTLWYATNGAEVGRMEANLHASGVKPISFLEGLKRTLNAQEVRTNTFGRAILMAGLLSVSWHMNQRDLQVNSLGVSQALGGRDKWRGSLTRAFDLWKQDFDRSLVRQTDSIPGPYLFTERKSESAAFQSRIVLHHLAHMSMHVDVVDCQIFARAKRLLGRSIGPQDLHGAQRRMREVWAPTAKARDATWYALRFLRTVLLPDEDTPTTSHTHGGNPDTAFDYSARDDVLLNRPWVMYFAALIVWAYGYALEGPTTAPLPASYDFDDQVRDMRSYLRRLGGAGSPEELKSLRGFNGCTGMLMVLRKCFETTRWELLHEAAVLLGNCVGLIKGTM